MSRHHMLPPIIYTPQPKPKKIESRKSRVQLRSASGVKAAGVADEVEEASAFGPAGKPPLDNYPAIEGSERKLWSTTGRLSEQTLQAMLQVQEREG